MTGRYRQAHPRLEQRVRLLLRAYPTGYRTSRGDEIVATVLEAARPGQRMPHPADAADLVWAGLRVRLAVLVRRSRPEPGSRPPSRWPWRPGSRPICGGGSSR